MAAAGDAADPAPQRVAEATHDLYRQYGKQIYAYCLHQLRSREEAEDAVQTTFLNAFRGLQRGTTTRFEQAWLYKIAQNVCIARRSSSGRRLRLESPDDFEILQEVVPSSAPADGDTLELMGLDTALDSMPENQRRAILMREWQGMSYREIATELALTQGAVEMLIFRARRTLANALEQPAAEKKHVSKARTGFSLGSIVAALKSMFSTGVAMKMAAVAVSAAVVSTNGVVHSVISHVASPAKRRVAAVHVQTVRTVAPAKPVAVVTPHDIATVAKRVVRTATPEEAPATVVPAVPAAPAPAPPPAPVQVPPAMAPPQLLPAPAPQAAPPPTTPSPAPPPAEPAPPTALPSQSQTTVGTGAAKDGARDSQTWNAPRETQTDTTTTTTTIAPPSPTTATRAPGPIAAPAPVLPIVTATTTTTVTTTSDPPQPQPVPPPSSDATTWRGGGRGNGLGGGGHDGGGDWGHGHH